MAKIDSYPTITPPVSGGDMLIGTDINDNNNTKNFTVSQLITYITSTGTYVPYVGATNGLNLGVNDIFAENGIFNTSVSTNEISLFGALNVSGNPGSAGDVLTSQGAGLPPVWSAAQSEVVNVKATLSSSDILSMGTSPFVLVPSVLGKCIIPLSIVIDFKFGTSAYVSGGGVNVVNGNTLYIANVSGIITSAFDLSYFTGGISGITSFSPLIFGSPLTITINGGTDPLAGDGTMDVYVTYTLI